jgi:hypothetical protein
VDCIPGSFSSQVGAETCTPCAGGSIAASEGATFCKPCFPGKFAASGQTVCTSCSPGLFTAFSNSSQCLKCPTGSSSNGDFSGCICDPKYYFVCDNSGSLSGMKLQFLPLFVLLSHIFNYVPFVITCLSQLQAIDLPLVLVKNALLLSIAAYQALKP